MGFSKMASSNISSFNSRIQFSVDQAPKNAGNSIIGAAIDRHNAETQGTLYNHKGTGKIANIIDTQNAVKSDTKQTAPPSTTNIDMIPKDQFGHIKLDISNSVLPYEKLNQSPSSNDGLPDDVEIQIRSLGCELIQLAGKLLKLPQVAMATGCVLFQRFFYAKSLVRYPFDHVAMACIGLASKIEESPRRVRDIINVFHHIKQIRNGRTIQPMVLDQNYIHLKNQVIKAERRVLKELGFCVHVKHPHKIIVMYLQVLEGEKNGRLVQCAWNYMNDSFRTDAFVRFQPETIACACIYLAARQLQVPLPNNPHWFTMFGVAEEEVRDISFSILKLYTRNKPNADHLEKVVNEAKKVQVAAKLKAKGISSDVGTPNSRPGTPSKVSPSPLTVPSIKKLKSEDDKSDHSSNGYRKKRVHSRSRSRSRSKTRSYSSSRSRSRSYSPGGKRNRHRSPKKYKHDSRRKDKHSYYKDNNDYNKHSGHKRHQTAYSPSPKRRSYSRSPDRKSKKYYKEKERFRSGSRERRRGKKHNGHTRSHSRDRYRR